MKMVRIFQVTDYKIQYIKNTNLNIHKSTNEKKKP